MFFTERFYNMHCLPCLFTLLHIKNEVSPDHAAVITKPAYTRGMRKLQNWELSRNSVTVCISFPPVCGSVVPSLSFTFFPSHFLSPVHHKQAPSITTCV